MEFIAEYAGFLARTVTVLAAIIVVLVVIVALRGRGRRGAGVQQARREREGPGCAGGRGGKSFDGSFHVVEFSGYPVADDEFKDLREIDRSGEYHL